MNEQTLFLIFFVIISVSFYYGVDTFYEQFDVFKNLNFDFVTWRLISLALAAIFCAVIWNYYVSNYV